MIILKALSSCKAIHCEQVCLRKRLTVGELGPSTQAGGLGYYIDLVWYMVTKALFSNACYEQTFVLLYSLQIILHINDLCYLDVVCKSCDKIW